MMNEIEETITKIREEFKGYHVCINLWPSGGILDAGGCRECGTSNDILEIVKWKHKKGETIETAIEELKNKLKRVNNETRRV